MADITYQLSKIQALKGIGIAYFEARLLAMSTDLAAAEFAYCIGRLTKIEFLGIFRSLTQAMQDVEAALVGLQNDLRQSSTVRNTF